MNELEIKIYQEMIKNKGVLNEEIYLMTAEVLADDDMKIEKCKKLLEGQLKKIQHIFNRLSPECNLEKQSIVDWICYIYGIGDE